MGNQPELATFKANCSSGNGFDLYWIVSRTQIEFILKDIDAFSSPGIATTTQYQGSMLPVIGLETFFGLAIKEAGAALKYIVLRAVNKEQELVRLMVETPYSVKFVKYEGQFRPLQNLKVPKNGSSLLGVYTLEEGRVGMMPDLVAIANSLKWSRE